MESFVKVPGIVFLKANPHYTGSHVGMSYRIAVEGEELEVSIWPIPYAYAMADAEQMSSERFACTVEGIHEAENWIAEQYFADEKKWSERRFA